MTLPEKNTFIPQDFSILNAQDENNNEKPRLIHSSSNSELFFLPDKKFNLPKLKITMFIYLPGQKIFDSPKNYIIMTMFNYALKTYLKEFMYMANMADIKVHISAMGNGLKLTGSGYNDKFGNFLKELATRICLFCKAEGEVLDFFVKMFPLFKLKRFEELENQLKIAPYNQYGMLMSELIYTGYFDNPTLMEEVNKLSMEDYLEVHKTLLSKVYTETLICGNLTEKNAKEIELNFTDTLKNNKLFGNLSIDEIRENRLIAIKPNNIGVYEMELKNADEKNSVIGVEFQLEQDPSYEYLNKILEDFLSSLYFEDLRSEQQVGYVVFSLQCQRKNTSGFIFLIQSDKFLPSDLAEKTYEFLLKQRDNISKITDEKFNEIREGILAKFRQDFTSLGLQSNFYMEQIKLSLIHI